jgi:hypothetical protein
VGQNGSYINSALVYGGGQSADSALYIAKPEGLFRILDTESGPSQRAELVMELGVADEHTGQVLVEHRGELYIGVGGEVFRYNLGQIDAASWNKDHGLPVTMDGHTRAAASTGRHLYVMVVPPNNSFLSKALVFGYQQVVETTHGEAWHQVHTSANAKVPSTTPLEADASETQALTPDRWNGASLEVLSPVATHSSWACLLFAGGESGNKLYRLPIRIGNEKLRETLLPWGATPTYGYMPRTVASLILPPFYSSRRLIEKVWHWVQISQKPVTVPDVARMQIYARLIQPAVNSATSSYVGLTANMNGATAAQGGYLFRSNFFRQEFRYWDIYNPLVPAANPFGRGVSDGIDLKFYFSAGNQVGDLRAPAVLLDPTIAFSEASAALRTWVLNVNIAMLTLLPDGTTILLTEEQVTDQVARLEAFATNTGAIIVTDPLDQELIVRVDLGPMRVPQREMRYDQAGFLMTDNLSYNVQVTLTELFAPEDFTHTAANPY